MADGYLISPDTAWKLQDLLRSVDGDGTGIGGLKRANNQQWIEITAAGQTTTIGEVSIDFFPAKVIRFDSSTLTWVDYAAILAFSPNGLTLRLGTKYLGYGFGYIEGLQAFAVTSECCANLKWYCMERVDWYCLTSPDEEPFTACYQLTEADYELMQGAGYIVESGPHDTEEECLAECEES